MSLYDEDFLSSFELPDGGLVRAEEDDYGRPVLRVLTRQDLRDEARAQGGLREVRRVERLAAEVFRIWKAELYARMKRLLSPEAYKVWVYRHSFAYAVKKAWSEPSIMEQLHDANPLLDVLEGKSGVVPIHKSE